VAVVVDRIEPAIRDRFPEVERIYLEEESIGPRRRPARREPGCKRRPALTSNEPSPKLCLTMQGNPKIIALLNEALKEELTAINQYFLHAEMCENWHYKKLGSYVKKQSIDEMKHAEALIERILFLDGTPNMTELMKLTVGQNVREQLESDLRLEIDAVAMYNRAIRAARDESDNASRELFERLLRDEEEHVDWLEAQLHQIGEMGYERYLSQQIREEK
jgi:bacterioferritin